MCDKTRWKRCHFFRREGRIMKCYNKKKKPKHWTKPKWETRATATSTIRNYLLVTRGMKNKYKHYDFYNYFLNNKPEIKILGKDWNGTFKKKKGGKNGINRGNTCWYGKWKIQNNCRTL